MKISHSQLHMWEETCISGQRGSGTIFFSGCTLHCVYCQNKDISRGITGKDYTPEECADLMLDLEAKGAHNINLVTPDLYLLDVKEAIVRARDKGLNIPMLFNIGGYESPDALKKFEGLVDIYLADFKYWDDDEGYRLSKVKNYPGMAKEAFSEMMYQHPYPVYGEDGMMKEGVIARHLLLPNHRKSAEHIVKYLYDTYGDNIVLSLMSQFTPIDIDPEYSDINRKVTKREYGKLLDYVMELGISNCFIQEGNVAKESFIPKFT